MSGPQLSLAVSVFLACVVEAVEALTIVLAVGSTRSWRSAFSGVAAALLALLLLIAALGPAITSLPINVLRILVGGLLLIFGLQRLRKAILRAAGLKPMHDEEAIFEAEAVAAEGAGVTSAGLDGYSFAIAFKGCCWRVSRWPSSSSPSAPTRAMSASRRRWPLSPWC
jgi:uncharacterized membrane protein